MGDGWCCGSAIVKVGGGDGSPCIIIKLGTFANLMEVCHEELETKGLSVEADSYVKQSLKNQIEYIEKYKEKDPVLAEAQIQQIGHFSRFYKEMTGVDLELDIAPEGINNQEASRLEYKKKER